MATITRTQRAYQSVTDEGTLTVNIYSPVRDADGKQAVVIKRVYDASTLPSKMSNICLAKGLGFYMAGRYSPTDSDEDLTPEDIASACDLLYKEMQDGTFSPGRGTGEARPTPFFEALAEYLKMDISDVLTQVRADKVTFSAGQLAKMAKFPAVAVITARIERERAAEKEKRAKAAVKTAAEMDIAALFTVANATVTEADAEATESAAAD